MGERGDRQRRGPIFYPQTRAWETPPPAVPASRPLEYRLVDLLADDGVPEAVTEAIGTLLPFIGKVRREEAIKAEEGDLAALRHDLERVMDRENRYLNALMEITALREGDAVKIAGDALYRQPPAPPKEQCSCMASGETRPDKDCPDCEGSGLATALPSRRADDAEGGTAGTEGSAVAEGQTPKGDGQ